MGSKSIIFFGTLICALFLYYSIYKPDIPELIASSKTETITQKATEPEPESKPELKPEPQPEPKQEQAIPIKEEPVIKQDAKVTAQRISIPAFGFMSSKKKNQIVALMSDNDENGILAKQIESLCKNKECAKDMRFENDILDASWQEGAVKIIELFTNGDIENGSLFIEGNMLKLEGDVRGYEAQGALNTVLNSLRSDTFKIQNYTKPVKNTQEANTTQPVVSKPKDVVKSKDTVKPEVKKTSLTPLKPEKTKPTSKPVAIPEPVMETTLDTSTQITLEDNIEDNTPQTGLVAEPTLKTTGAEVVENEDDVQKQINDLLLEPIQFETKDNLIVNESKKRLDKIIKIINASEDRDIIVSGHTDYGSDKIYNKVLSQKRADIVMRYLRNNGIKSTHISSVGYGDEKPNESGSNNERIEIQYTTGE